MIDHIQNFTNTLPDWLQWLGVVLAGAIPFIESYIGASIGIIAGLHPVVAVLAAVTGNFITMLALVTIAHRTRKRFTTQSDSPSPRQARLKRAFDRYGVAGVSLVGQTILPSQLTSAALVSFGASKQHVIVWQSVSIVLWGILFALITTGAFAFFH